MKKSEIKTGYLIELRDGDIGMVSLNTDAGDLICPIISDKTTWGSFDHWKEDLTWGDDDYYIARSCDIVRVYGLSSNNSHVNQLVLSTREILWERSE